MSTLVTKTAKETNQPVEVVARHWERAKALADERFGSTSSAKSSEYYDFATQVMLNTLSVRSVSLSKKAKKVDETGRDWWDRMTRQQQVQYLKDHPKRAKKLRVKPNGAPVLKGRKRLKVNVDSGHEDDQVVEPAEDPIKERKKADESLQPKEPEAEKTPEVVEKKPKIRSAEHAPEPQSLKGLTNVGRAVIHKAVSKGMSKIGTIAEGKKQTFKGGLHALKKFSNDEKLSDEDKGHLKDMTTIIMGVTLASAVAFTPFLPFAAGMTDLYLDHLAKRKEAKNERNYTDPYEPGVVEDPELSSFTGEEQQSLQHTSSSIVDWVADNHDDADELINQARALQNKEN